MSAPTLPTKAERDRWRKPDLAGMVHHPDAAIAALASRLLRLLDWADAADGRDWYLVAGMTRDERAAIRRVAIKAELDQSPMGALLLRLLDALESSAVAEKFDRDTFAAMGPEARAVLSGGQPAAVGPWALRHPTLPRWWFDNGLDANGGWWVYAEGKAHRTIYEALGSRHDTPQGPAPGTARWAQRLHGGVIVAARNKSTGGG